MDASLPRVSPLLCGFGWEDRPPIDKRGDGNEFVLSSCVLSHYQDSNRVLPSVRSNICIRTIAGLSLKPDARREESRAKSQGQGIICREKICNQRMPEDVNEPVGWFGECCKSETRAGPLKCRLGRVGNAS